MSTPSYELTTEPNSTCLRRQQPQDRGRVVPKQLKSSELPPRRAEKLEATKKCECKHAKLFVFRIGAEDTTKSTSHTGVVRVLGANRSSRNAKTLSRDESIFLLVDRREQLCRAGTFPVKY